MSYSACVARHWDDKKDLEKRKQYGFGFHELVSEGKFLKSKPHPFRDDQELFLVSYESYIWVMVYEPKRDRFATFYPSRKAKKEVKDEKD